mmetsp:Transcript_6227/g.10146  ORF Transcript_6227/g.10146 Transcript_6227/m.10146 type:complete len:116 (+) Transcript_6227:592-939(+)
MLISQQVKGGQELERRDLETQFNDDIQEMKENLERKEYLLQYNEQKYHQYEKVLRDLILNTDTPEPVKDQLREKIEQQELFVPKDERKISNIIQQNHEKIEIISVLKQENKKMRD